MPRTWRKKYTTRWRKYCGDQSHQRGKQGVDGKDFRLAEEIRYIQQKAAHHILRMVTIGQLILFSTQTGDAKRNRSSALV